MLAEGCVFRECGPGETLDIAAGACVAASLAADCGDGGAPLVEGGQTECVPATATCPRGATRAGSAAGAVCARPLRCPPGSLPDTDKRDEPERRGPADKPERCRAITATTRRVDTGAWAVLVLGMDGGPGTDDLCRPLAQRPAAFGLAREQKAALVLRIRLTAPDADLTRVRSEVHVRGPDGRAVPPAGAAVAERSVASLVEGLRSTGGEAEAQALDLAVTCVVEVR
jgi:hypothetical protein